MNEADRCDLGMLAGGAVAFSIFQTYFSFVSQD